MMEAFQGMVSHQHQTGLMSSGADGYQLMQYILAASSFIHHALHASGLAFYSAQSVSEILSHWG